MKVPVTGNVGDTERHAVELVVAHGRAKLGKIFRKYQLDVLMYRLRTPALIALSDGWPLYLNSCRQHLYTMNAARRD
ncbi:dTDP-glucose 4,6-dehydratase [Pseudomonas sp. MT-1]|uniref:hypothetical protein n=1 Tax=Stutzerimonas stutzeri TaxID=316 RepID=UPI000535C8AB|nr:hypothetical protein [Stutzerimonas stutzeri]MCQ4283511.1 hypothetical protein [Stutzerimonas stutzeri]BAP80160.1 dTDP-glucose 4,6-dehydratase [Pseudomonas sp. MT-1]